jgi:hypothetical protein
VVARPAGVPSRPFLRRITQYHEGNDAKHRQDEDEDCSNHDQVPCEMWHERGFEPKLGGTGQLAVMWAGRGGEGRRPPSTSAIGFNDWRGTATQMAFSPAELEDCYDVSRNLGDNRGHGLHPSLFKPSGN